MAKRDQKLKDIYDDFLDFIMRKLLQYEDTQMVASTMIASRSLGPLSCIILFSFFF